MVTHRANLSVGVALAKLEGTRVLVAAAPPAGFAAKRYRAGSRTQLRHSRCGCPLIGFVVRVRWPGESRGDEVGGLSVGTGDPRGVDLERGCPSTRVAQPACHSA